MKIQTCTMPQFLTTLKLVHKHLIRYMCHNSTKYLLQNAVTEKPQEKILDFPGSD